MGSEKLNDLKKPMSKMTKKEQLMQKQKPNFLLEENRLDKNMRRPSD
jgi:hypothetical protein